VGQDGDDQLLVRAPPCQHKRESDTSRSRGGDGEGTEGEGRRTCEGLAELLAVLGDGRDSGGDGEGRHWSGAVSASA
jgi:hypothetical protein